MILLVDNYDSFVYNLARYFQRLGQRTAVVRNDALSLAEIRRARPRAIVLSPGPCTPADAGASVEIVRELHREVPLLGICLGHQAIAAALGAEIVRAAAPMHGRTSLVEHVGSPLFAEIPSPFVACRYHSLVVERRSTPADLVVTATADDGTIMAIEHSKYPICGVQFHPESILTEQGFQVLANFLALAGIAGLPDPESLLADELPTRDRAEFLNWPQPVTF